MHNETLNTILYVLFFCLIAACPLSLTSLTTYDLPKADALENVQGAYSFYHNLLRAGTRDPGYNADVMAKATREPLYPAILSLTLRGFGGQNLKAHGFKCFEIANLCPDVLYRTKLVNWVFYVLSCVTLGLSIIFLTRRRWLALFIMALLSVNSAMITVTNNWMTEPPALFFLLIHSVALYAAYASRYRKSAAIIAGVTLAALILTKTIFLYLPIFYALGILAAFVIADIKKKPDLAAHAKNFIIAVGIAAILITPSLIADQKASTSIASKMERGSAVLAIRAEYDAMPWSDIPHAFIFFTPDIGPKIILKYFEQETYDRFYRDSDKSYYRKVKNGEGLAYDLAKKDKISLQSAALTIIKQNWLKHIALSPAFAYEGLFIPKKAYFDNYKCSASKAISTIVNFSLIILCIAGVVYLIRIGRYEYLLLAAPAIYSFGMHSFLTHYWPRYSIPLLGIGLVFLSVVYDVAKARRARLKDGLY